MSPGATQAINRAEVEEPRSTTKDRDASEVCIWIVELVGNHSDLALVYKVVCIEKSPINHRFFILD